jgi:hypothetical protein
MCRPSTRVCDEFAALGELACYARDGAMPMGIKTPSRRFTAAVAVNFAYGGECFRLESADFTGF